MKEKNSAIKAIQVCLTINNGNFDREFNGLLEAMKQLGIKEGTIITLEQSDVFEKDDFVIRMIPVNEFYINKISA